MRAVPVLCWQEQRLNAGVCFMMWIAVHCAAVPHPSRLQGTEAKQPERQARPAVEVQSRRSAAGSCSATRLIQQMGGAAHDL